MMFSDCEKELLGLLAELPFADRLDLTALSGWSRGAVYAGMDRLQEGRLVDAIPHATPLLPRYCLTSRGLLCLADIAAMPQEEMLRRRPVSAQWQRVLLQRLDALAVIYRLVAAVSNAAFPIRVRLFRAGPVDAAIVLPEGRTVAVVRQGLTVDRTGFSKRLWRLREGTPPGGLLVLAPDDVRLRQARRMLNGANFPVFLGLERDATVAGLDSPVWRPPTIAVDLDLRYILTHLDPRGSLPKESQFTRHASPVGITSDTRGPDWLLPSVLGPAEKRVLDLVSDWPWVSRRDLAGIMGVSVRRVAQLVGRLKDMGLVHQADDGRHGRLVLSDRGLGLLARRDRVSVGAARRRWSAASLNPPAPLSWRNVSGSRSRQLLRNLDHTSAVHRFLVALCEQARAAGWEAVELDPPWRASRYFRYEGRLHSVLPDAFGVLRLGNKTLPFFLEWERRAVRPVTMAARLAPYLRYYSSPRPLDDHGAEPVVLVVFDEELAASHFPRLTRREMDRSGVDVPLRISHRKALEQLGPLGRAWQIPGLWQPHYAFEG
ncbi:MAG: replication-relaxation family protein [Chloroflexota bacterium]|nr:replication-relaxation family protein [Chloroflexota bacterium]